MNYLPTQKYREANLKINKSLYSFSDGYLIKTIRALDDAFDSAIVFSHNHGINDFVKFSKILNFIKSF